MQFNRLARYGALLGVLTCSFVASVLAQCRPPQDSHEARLLAFYTVPIVFSADASALALTPGSVRIALEGAYVPTASSTLQQTDFCYAGRAENTGLTSFFGRPRLSIGLPHGFGLEASYLPPITVANATPNLASAAVIFTHVANARYLLSVRAHGTLGIVKGPITCPDNALQQTDAQAPCYGTRASTDEFRPDMAGLELIASTNSSGESRLRLSAGVGVNRLYPRFKVGFSDLNGGTDRTEIEVNLTRFTGLVGATVTLNQRCGTSAQLYSSFADATTARATLSCRLH